MTATALATIADLEQRRDRCELVEGMIVTMSPAGFEHGQISMILAGLIFDHVRSRSLGAVLSSDTGFILSRDPDTVRAPDVAFISQARLDQAQGTGYSPIAPDLAVEVVSPSDAMQDVELKVHQYLDAGTRLVWVVLPRLRLVREHRRDGLREYGPDDRLDGGAVLPGFSVPVRELFP